MDSLWDDSQILERSPPRQRSSLFLDSPSASPVKGATSTTSPKETATNASSTRHSAQPDLDDIDALFADIDDLNDESRPSRETRSKDAKSVRPSAVVNVLLSDDEEDVTNVAAAGKDDDDEGPKKKKRKLVKLDENRLLGENGLKALVNQHKDFKPRGKGHEARDLKRLLQVYQFWCVKMHPRGDFRETIQKVEKLCHSRRMHNALNSWKNDLAAAENGVLHTVEGGDEIQIQSDSDDETPAVLKASTPRRSPTPPEDRNREAGPSNPAKPTLRSVPVDDDWDFDAMLDEEEREQEKIQAQQTLARKSGDNDEIMEDGPQPPTPPISSPLQPPTQLPTSSPIREDAEDDEIWQMLAEMETQEA